MVGGQDTNEEEKSDIPYGKEEALHRFINHKVKRFRAHGYLCFIIAGHFPCKAISKIVQLPTEEG